jgi:serine phosphatase RsbU (regulator of sigma subunit)
MSFNVALSAVYLAGGIVTFLLGITILRQNPRGLVNRATALMLFAGGTGPLLGVIDLLANPHLIPGTFLYTNLVTNFEYVWEFFFPALLVFSLSYPSENRWLRRFPRAIWLVFVPHVFHLVLLVSLSGRAAMEDVLPPVKREVLSTGITAFLNQAVQLTNLLLGLLLRAHRYLFSLVNIFYAGVSVFLLVRSLRSTVIPRVRRQLAVVLGGLGVGVLTYSSAKFVPQLLGSQLPLLWESGLVNASLLVGSISIAYAIVRYQFLDMRFLARRSVLYGAAVVIFGLFYLLVLKQMTAFLVRYTSVDENLVDTVFIVLALLAFQPAISRIEDFVEHLFSLDRQGQRPTLTALSREIVSLYNFEDLRRRVTETLRDSLAVRKVEFLRIESRNGSLLLEGTEVNEEDDDELVRYLRRGIQSLEGIGEPITRRDLLLVSPELESAARELAGGRSPVAANPRARGPQPATAGSGTTDGGAGTATALETGAGDPLRLAEDTLRRLTGYELLVPLVLNRRSRGLIGLGEKIGGARFTTDDLAFLSLLSNQICVALENMSLLEQIVEKRLLDQELGLARRIQRGLLPGRYPEVEDYEFNALSHSSKQVSGDYYDIIRLENGRVCLAVADVAGKGVPAAILMANLQAALRTNLELETDPDKIMEALNRLLYGHTPSESFATFFLAVLDPRNHRMTYANAGHSYPVLVGANGLPRLLEESDLVLGMLENVPFGERRLKLKPGELLVIYTDGLTEAMNRGEELYGEERLLDFLRRHHGMGLEEMGKRLVDEVDAFTGGVERSDDITVVLVRRSPA